MEVNYCPSILIYQPITRFIQSCQRTLSCMRLPIAMVGFIFSHAMQSRPFCPKKTKIAQEYFEDYAIGYSLAPITKRMRFISIAIKYLEIHRHRQIQWILPIYLPKSFDAGKSDTMPYKVFTNTTICLYIYGVLRTMYNIYQITQTIIYI